MMACNLYEIYDIITIQIIQLLHIIKSSLFYFEMLYQIINYMIVVRLLTHGNYHEFII